MKRISLLFLTLFLIVQGAYSLSYSAYLSLDTGYLLTKIKDDEIMRSSYALSIEAEPFGLSFGRNTISIPIMLSFYSSSPEYRYYSLNAHNDCGIALAYRYAFTDLFTLKTQAGLAYRHYPDIDASTISFLISSSAEFYPAHYTAIVLPLDILITKDEVAFSIGLGCLVRLGGER